MPIRSGLLGNFRIADVLPALWSKKEGHRSTRRRRSQRVLTAQAMEARIVPAVTAQEQLFLELLNRARANPNAEAARYGIDLNEGSPSTTITADPKQPLAPNTILHDVMDSHLQTLINADLFQHNSPDGTAFFTRIRNAGYNYTTVRENLVFSASNDGQFNLTPAAVEQLHSILFIDAGVAGRGHRVNMMAANVNEVGAAIELGTSYTYNGRTYPSVGMGGHDFGSRGGNSFITGVAYTDSVTADSFYTIGEGLGGVTVVATDGAGNTFRGVANEAGGYALQVPNGSYTISFSGGNLQGTISKSVTINGANVKVDANTRVDTPAVLPTVSFAPSSYSVNESRSSITLTIRLNQASNSATTVNYSVVGSTAVAGQDFTAVSGTVTFAAGQVAKTFAVPILNNAAVEANEVFVVRLTNPSGLTLGTASATVTIIDDDEVAGPATDIVAQNAATGGWLLIRSDGTKLIQTSFGTTRANLINEVSGDFNGDGRLDVGGRDRTTGRWIIGLNNGVGFTVSDWSGWTTSMAYSNIRVGDFTGDGLDDIAAFDASGQRVFVGRSTGSSFATTTWSTIGITGSWSDFVMGDYNGDRRQDLMIRNLRTGALYGFLSTGTAFATRTMGTYLTNYTWTNVMSGDFNGDGKDDIVSYVASQARLYVGISTGSSYSIRQWSQLPTGQTWGNFFVGKFNSDNRADVFTRNQRTGDLYVSLSTGTAGTPQKWGNWSPNYVWSDLMIGDFNGDGLDDVGSRVVSQGNVYVATSTGASFRTSQWGVLSSSVTWKNIFGDEVV